MNTLQREPYDGPSRKLVLGIDVGTTYSGVSYCILEPGEIPIVWGVTRYPGTDHVGGNSKIPTILYYDQSGIVQKAGAEAEDVDEQANENGWTKVEWFKLHLCPKSLSTSHVTKKIPPLPEGKSAVQVFADFLSYLYRCAREYIQDSQLDGENLWLELEGSAEIVLTHPNGWEGGQQALMRKAAILAGVIPDTNNGKSRLFFVPEGEASLHFCVNNGLLTKMLDSKGILIADAGGGTIDVSAYEKVSVHPQGYEEIAAPQCSLNGSVLVTQTAREYLENHLKGSKFADDVPSIVKEFDQHTKPRFSRADEVQYIKFGRWSDHCPSLNIKSGQLKLSGSDVAKFFEPSMSSIVEMIEYQCETAQKEITSVFLVGGLAASNWLFNNLKVILTSRGLDICRPEKHTSKAVADGAVSYHIDHLVAARISKYSYGIRASIPYNPSDMEHAVRQHLVYTDIIHGNKKMGGHFGVILSKNTKVSKTKEFRRSFYRENQTESDMNIARISVSEGRKNPRNGSMNKKVHLYSSLCYVEADLSPAPKTVRYSRHIQKTYNRVEFDVILSFGLTEFKACIAWKENDEEKRSAAVLVYDPDGVDS